MKTTVEKDRHMTIRGIPKDAADLFVAACKANHKKVGEVLQEFMEDYTSKTWKRLGKNASEA